MRYNEYVISTLKCYGECKQELPVSEFHLNRAHPRGYKMTCRECSRVLGRKYYANNKDKYQKYIDKEVHAAACAKWSKENKDKRCRSSHKRRTLIAESGHYSVEEWSQLVESYGNRCLNPNCNSVWPYKITVDHVKPLSKGGTNTVDNLQPLCFSCNASKGARTIDYRLITIRSKI